MLKLIQRKSNKLKAHLRYVLGEYDLPSFPTAVMKALEIIRNPASSSTEIAEALSADPGLSVQVLKTVNSAAYSPRDRVEDVTQAVMLLGTTTLESIVLSVAVTQVLPRTTEPGYVFPRFWRASVQRAFVARSFADILHPAHKSLSFTAGLLQDMALPFLAAKRTDDYSQVLEQWLIGSDDLASLERNRFDWDHAEVATWLGQSWNLPKTLVDAIGESHGTLDLGGHCPPAVVLVSCIRESPEHPGIDLLIDTASSRYGVEKDTAIQLVDTSLQQAEDFITTMQ